MDDFSQPDAPNVYGLAPSATNYVRPGKKPLSSMAPTLITLPDNTLRAALGASGGPRILSALLQTLIRCVAPPTCWGQGRRTCMQESLAGAWFAQRKRNLSQLSIGAHQIMPVFVSPAATSLLPTL